MTKDEKCEKFFRVILEQQFSLVGQKYSPELTEGENWYTRFSWSEETEEEFRKFFVITAKRMLGWNKRIAEKEFLWWNLCWGWKRK